MQELEKKLLLNWPNKAHILYNVYFTVKLAKVLQPEGITVNALHPGFVNSNFGNSPNWGVKILRFLMKPFQISVQKGVQISIYLAYSSEVNDVSGRYFAKQKQAKFSDLAKNQANIDRFWEVSKKLMRIREFGNVPALHQ